jgi:uncharacterized metal-binding protein YceD (DUF177 family)
MAQDPEASPAAADDLPRQVYRVAALTGRKRTHVIFAPDGAARGQIAALLGLIELPALRLEGDITPDGRHDLRFEGEMTAEAVQACIVTLAPVPVSLKEPVLRRYLKDFAEPVAEEAEMDSDDSAEPLPDEIDAAAVAMEALSLALPLYPRAPGAELGEAVFAPPGAEPLRDADLRPFAGLAALVRKAPEEDQ